MAGALLTDRGTPGPESGILDHRGIPFRETGDAFALPHVWTFGGLMGQAWRAYWHEGWDEARKHAHVDAQAMEQDCGLMGLLQERKLAVASLPWHLEIPDDKDPEQVKVRDALATAVQGIRGFRQLLMCLLDAIWYGRHAAQVRWRWTWNDGERVLTPCAWRPVRGDKIGHKWDGAPYVMILPHVANEIRDAEVINTTAGGRGLVLRGPWRERFLIHRHEPVDADFLDLSGAEAIHGVGVRSRVFWLDWLKRKWLANVTEYMERVGLGVELWYYDPSNPRSKAETERGAREQTASRTRLLVPRWGADRQPGLERVEVPTSGAEFLRKLIEHVEELQERYIVGQSMSASAKGGAGGLGNEAAADFQRDTKDQVRNYDATNLAEVALTGDEDEPGLLSIMQRWSFPDTIPSEDNREGFWVKFRFSLEHMESVEKLQSVSVVTGLGLPVKQDEIYSLAGLTRPDPGDDVVEGIREDPNAQGGEGGGNGKSKGNGDGDGKTWTAEHGPKGGHHLVNKATGHSQPMKGGRKVPFSREGHPSRFSYDPDEPRIPAGQSGGGEWTAGGGGGKREPAHEMKIAGKRSVGRAVSKSDGVAIYAFRRYGGLGWSGDGENIRKTKAEAYADARKSAEMPESGLGKEGADEAGVRLYDDVPIEKLPWSGNMSVPADWRSLTSDPGELDEVTVRNIEDIRPSEESSRQAINALKEHIQDPENDLPPIIVEYDGEKGFYILDGNTRFLAAKELGYQRIPIREHLQEDEPEQGTLFRRPGRPERFAKEAGHWVTIGAKAGGDGKKHGGTPVYIENGRITKGAPGMVGKKIGALKEEGEHGGTRKQNKQGAEYGRAVWAKKARKEGLDPAHLHQLAAEMVAHHAEGSADLTRMLKEVRAKYPHTKTVAARNARGIDTDQVKGLDDIAASFAGRSEYGHLFAGHEGDEEQRLFDLLLAGNPEPMSEEDAYGEALEHLRAHRPEAAPDDDDDFVPFAREGAPERFAFDPNEPRVPAGQHGGGEWTKGGAASGGPEPDPGWEPAGFRKIKLSAIAPAVRHLIDDDDPHSPALDPAGDADAPLVNIVRGEDGRLRHYVVDGSHRLMGMIRWAEENDLSLDAVDVEVGVVPTRELALTAERPDSEHPSALAEHERALDHLYDVINKADEARKRRHARPDRPERFASSQPVVINVPAPVVNVTLPESAAPPQPAPVVNVTVPAPGPTVSTREVEYDEKGRVARTVTTEVPERPAQEPPA